MKQDYDKSFDFSVRIIELVKYLDEEKKPFPLSERLIACAAGIGIFLRLAGLTGRRSAENIVQALNCAVEAEFLLETMGKTGYLTEKQSLPIINDCRTLKTDVMELLHKAN
ncbi:MAG: four helix bundle protein [Bacillota bacterium]